VQSARFPQEPGDDLLAGVGGPAGSAVGEDRGFVPFEEDAAEPCDQGFLVPVADADGLEAGARPVRGLDGGLVTAAVLATVEPLAVPARTSRRSGSMPASRVDYRPLNRGSRLFIKA
jgi:hypothetical protein